ncbi:TRAP-type C4-dicarboxylate transport system permease small subunit [Georgenia soli]|uniref:TRAP-type C4-dicarboxylate transport system permease small subunit n=1 Tax=Georgenia soli TaxID=638953 RepID=A0A2A9EL61_9MICO|nr:TRAP transporter small permease [Georgenia soli]PFG39827.1 TRAP-type C4-dicarboxylate transport system permease small subunit [Georgenia soli]
MEKTAESIATPLGVLASISTIVMMLGISADVVYRNIQGETLAGVLELSESALVATVFFGLAYASINGSHIAVDLLVTRLPRRVAQWTMFVTWLLSAAVLAWLTYASVGRATDSLARSEARMGLVSWPLWPARWFIVIGFAAFLVVAITNIVRLLRGRMPMGEEEGIQL